MISTGSPATQYATTSYGNQGYQSVPLPSYPQSGTTIVGPGTTSYGPPYGSGGGYVPGYQGRKRRSLDDKLGDDKKLEDKKSEKKAILPFGLDQTIGQALLAGSGSSSSSAPSPQPVPNSYYPADNFQAQQMQAQALYQQQQQLLQSQQQAGNGYGQQALANGYGQQQPQQQLPAGVPADYGRRPQLQPTTGYPPNSIYAPPNSPYGTPGAVYGHQAQYPQSSAYGQQLQQPSYGPQTPAYGQQPQSYYQPSASGQTGYPQPHSAAAPYPGHQQPQIQPTYPGLGRNPRPYQRKGAQAKQAQGKNPAKEVVETEDDEAEVRKVRDVSSDQANEKIIPIQIHKEISVGSPVMPFTMYQQPQQVSYPQPAPGVYQPQYVYVQPGYQSPYAQAPDPSIYEDDPDNSRSSGKPSA